MYSNCQIQRVFGEEMPEIKVWVDEKLSNGYIAIENIANWGACRP